MDRKIIGNLEQYDRKNKDNLQKVFGIFANEEFGEKVSEIFKYDLQTLIRSNRPQVRVLMGDNGTGKTTHLVFFKQILKNYYEGLNFFFEIDLRHIAEKTEKGLWLAIFNQIYAALSERKDIINILINYEPRDLRKIFRNTTIAKNIKNFGQDSSEEYFYGDKFQTISNIQSFFNGTIDILMKNKVLTVIAIDEVQQIEKWGDPVFQAFLESFVSSTYDRYMSSSNDARLFFILSFLLKSPTSREEKYSFLEKHSPGFVSRMKGKEIVFCNFTEDEHNNALKLCTDITNLTSKERTEFEVETKSKLTYWITRNNPREFGKYIKKVYKKLGLLKLTPPEMREIYEKEGREYIKSKLIKKGFNNIAEIPKKILGYDFDVYGETKHRTTIRKYAFGEIKTTQRKKLKSEVEKFSRWLGDVKNTSIYNHAENYYFFMSPYEPTPSTKEILDQYSIEWVKFKPPELIFEEGQEGEEEVGVASKIKEVKRISTETPLKTLKIPQLGPKRLQSLESEGIITIEDLREINLGMLAEKIVGISKKMLLNWKKECEKFINP